MTHDSLILDVPEHPFAPYVRILGKGKRGSRSFTQEEAYQAMSMILNGEVEDLQLGAFLMLLRVKEETAEELAGFVQAIKDLCHAPEIHVDLDWSSYAGKRRHLPWFVPALLLLAQAGHRIFIHGASGHTTNRIYTEPLFKALGLPLATNWEDCAEQLDQHNFVYMPLRGFSPCLERIIDMRNTLGLRSPVHSLARLINPLNAPAVLQGIFHPPYSGLHQEAGQLLGYQRLAVIKGEGGEIERNPDNAMKAFHASPSKMWEEEWPALFPRRHVKPESLSIEHLQAVWRGETEDEYAQGAIISTCALGLRMIKECDIQTAMAEAEQLWITRDKSRL
ncbi:MAG: glycosyl transferase family protein [Oleiphilaceae bacterium]|nr:glycosyl transferase family protein [Oleiphilaceae bacterium]